MTPGHGDKKWNSYYLLLCTIVYFLSLVLHSFSQYMEIGKDLERKRWIRKKHFQSHTKTVRSTVMIRLTQRASVIKLPTGLQLSKLLAFLLKKQIQKFNSLITEIGFLWVDILFSDNEKMWTCVMKNAYPSPYVLNTWDCLHNFSGVYPANLQPWRPGGMVA